MILKVLFIQRKCSYDGEFAPEAMVCIDEYCYDDGGQQWFEKEIDNSLKEQEGNISSHAIVEIDLNQDKLITLLNSNSKTNKQFMKGG